MRWLRRLGPCCLANSHRSEGGSPAAGRGGGGGGAESAGTLGVARALGMLWAARARAQVVRPEQAWARAHAPRTGLGRRRRAPSGSRGARQEEPEEGAEEKFP